jgi:hypothetical protein
VRVLLLPLLVGAAGPKMLLCVVSSRSARQYAFIAMFGDLREVAHAHEGESDEIQRSPQGRAHSRLAREILDHPSAIVGIQSTVHAGGNVATSTVLSLPKFVTIRAPYYDSRVFTQAGTG